MMRVNQHVRYRRARSSIVSKYSTAFFILTPFGLIYETEQEVCREQQQRTEVIQYKNFRLVKKRLSHFGTFGRIRSRLTARSRRNPSCNSFEKSGLVRNNVYKRKYTVEYV